jgi:ferrous iron transport protein B
MHSASGTDATTDRLTVVLLGNPNTGKSTLFSALAGIPARIGNYPGVTVEEKLGRFAHAGRTIEVIDLPGAYSLVPQSPDEQVTVDVLHGRMPSVPTPTCIIAVVDATNLERNLYLTSQALGLGLPMIVALTMSDVTEARGLAIDVAALSRRLGCPVVPVAAPAGRGLDALRDHLVSLPAPPPTPDLDVHLAAADPGQQPAAREAIARYAWIDSILADVVRRGTRPGRDLAERLDSLLTHRLWGTLVFSIVMLAVFSSIFWLAAPLMDLVSAGVDALAAGAEKLLPEGAVRALVVDGIIAGIGGVVVFVPQITLLFICIAILEGCGYLARAAFLMDRLLVGCGLGGRSFIPLLSSFACAIPGIMAARTIASPRERLLTILVAPLMSCSARLPVYLLFCGAFVPDVPVGVSWLRLPALVLAALYAVGVAVAAAVSFILSRTVLRGRSEAFVMELPGWRWPQPAVVLERAREAAWSFLTNAGTAILAVSVVVWALQWYPRDDARIDAEVESVRAMLQARAGNGELAAPERTEAEADLAALDTPEGLDAARRGAAQRQSFLGRAGKIVEPLVRPLGWDWRLGCAAIASFPAREVVLGTLGVIYNLGDVDPREDEGRTALVRRLRAATWDGTSRPVFTLPVALSVMVFFALCAQCASTLVIIGRETRSRIWPVVTFLYMTALAWLAAFVVYQVGTRLGW